jgi:hypothetical protein
MYITSAIVFDCMHISEIKKIKNKKKRLLARANGRGDRSQSGGHNKALSIEQEIVLVRVIDRIEFSGTHYRLPMISNIANFLLRKHTMIPKPYHLLLANFRLSDSSHASIQTRNSHFGIGTNWNSFSER